MFNALASESDGDGPRPIVIPPKSKKAKRPGFQLKLHAQLKDKNMWLNLSAEAIQFFGSEKQPSFLNFRGQSQPTLEIQNSFRS